MTKALVIAFALVACTPDLPEVATGVQEINDGDMQGVHSLGDLVDDQGSDAYFFWVGSGAGTVLGPRLPLRSVTVNVAHGHLVATDASHNVYTSGADLDGMIFASGTAALRVDEVQVPASGPYRYKLSFWGGMGWTPYCNSEISDRSVYAFAMQGRWKKSDRSHVDGSELSFGCEDSGVTAKCIDWGYELDGDHTTDSWKYHQTCSVMANANYCRNGPHTREQTPIKMRDYWSGGKKMPPDAPPALTVLDPTVTWPPVDGAYYYEAAWKPNGDVICLTRLRWASLAAGGYCPTDVPDPREGGSGVGFCEDLEFADLATTYNALMFDSTPVMDMFLYTWQTPQGERVTTVNGYVEGAIQIPPFSDEGMTYGQPRPDAILLRTLTGTLTVNGDPDSNLNVVEVFDQVGSGSGHDHVIAPVDSTLSPDHVQGAREGYLFTKSGAGRVEFNLYRHAMTVGTHTFMDYVSMTAPPPNSSYSLVHLLGYAIAP